MAVSWFGILFVGCVLMVSWGVSMLRDVVYNGWTGFWGNYSLLFAVVTVVVASVGLYSLAASLEDE
jgi:hypothetical protein